MADLADVEQALVAACAAAIPGYVVSGAHVRVFRGWPIKADLDADIAAGVCNVSVFPQPNVTTKTTRYPRSWQIQGSLVAPTLTWTISGNVLTLSGAVSAGQNVAIVANRQSFVHGVASADTIASIMAALSALLTADGITNSVSGAAITIAGYGINARTGGTQSIIQEVRRQRQGVMVTCWCPNPEVRDALAGAIDAALAPINFLTMPDGGAARLEYRSVASSDKAENEGVFRRDMIYVVEYATTVIETAAQVVAVQAQIAASPFAPPALTAELTLNAEQ